MPDNINELPSLYTVTGDIKDINTLLISREAVRLNAQAVSDEPNWRHPKIQGLIGAAARLRITIELIWRILEDPNQEFTASDMEYWDAIHDKLKEAISTKPAPRPAQAEPNAREMFNAGWCAAARFCDREDVVYDGLVGPAGCPAFEAAYREACTTLSAASAAPQPAQQPLTDEQAASLAKQLGWDTMPERFPLIVRAVEQAHGIGVKT